MSGEQGKKIIYDEKSFKAKMKVSSYTQVEEEFVGAEIRSIVGQEDATERFLSKQLQDLSLRKQNKGVRPPLVGQASSSSNDSVSLSFEGRPDVENFDQSPASQLGLIETPIDVDLGLNGINFARGNYTNQTPFLLNRDDYINQRPPEGSSDQINRIIQPLDNAQDFQRIRSSSSASSVTSSRPLEWDSGADVGYNQLYNAPGKTLDPGTGMSTLDRMVLACETNLLTRSDPEGTTGPSGLQQPVINTRPVQSRFQSRHKLGFPNAESTPIGTCVTSDVSPETVSEGLISPIKMSDAEKSSSSFEVQEDSTFTHKEFIENQSVISPPNQKMSKSKKPLFPEIINSSQQTSQQVVDDKSALNLTYHQQQENEVPVNEESVDTGSLQQLECHSKNRPPGFNNQLLCLHNETNLVCNSNSNKKLSSSLENISTIGGVPSDSKSQSNTLPRSQSQLHLNSEKRADENVDSRNSSNCPKYSMALHTLIHYNKSASSSSIATVVHKKEYSPKHVFTSVLKQESVGVQVCEGKDFDVVPSKVISEIQYNENPYLSKPVQAHPTRSNYFNFETIDKQVPKNTGQIHFVKSGVEHKTRTNETVFHSHNGVPCLGAHRRDLDTVVSNSKLLQEPQNHYAFNHNNNNGDCSLNDNVNRNRPITQGSSNNANNNLVFGIGTVDSIESSAKSGGCYTDNQYSVTVEDRVNSFEYLPGHIYENTERQPVDSRGTSSISIQNETSNNETPDEQGKTFDSSASASTTLEKDVQRGVDIISDFVKGSCANNSVLKKKLIRRVVEKLITKNYNDDNVEHADLRSNVPWVPSRPPNNIERNGRETRRSVNRSKVPCEFSSRSEKSGSTNASSECFIPRPAASSTFLPSSIRDNTCVSGQHSHSSTSEISIEKSTKNHGKAPHVFDIKAQVIKNGSVSKDISESSSSKTSRNSNWKEPTTKSEKQFEERRKTHSQSSSSQSEVLTLAQYLNMERENQLFWIKSEIQHLSNLRELLEKQEELKKGIKGLKAKRQRPLGEAVLKEKNRDRGEGVKGESGPSQRSDVKKKPSSLKTQSKYQPTLNAWLEKTATDSKVDSAVTSATSTDGIEDWASHHYQNENDENKISFTKRKIRHHNQKADKRMSSEDQRDRAIYDEPPLSRRGRTEEAKLSKQPSTPYRPRGSNKLDESIFVTDEGVTKKNAQTETLDTVGVQTSNSVQQLPVVHPNWFKQKQSQPKCRCVCRGSCPCCRENKSAVADNEEEKTKAVGYYITFEPSPRERDKLGFVHRPLEEVRIQVPMSEPKQRPSRRLRNEPGLRQREEPNVEERLRGDENTRQHERLRAGGNVEESGRRGNMRESERVRTETDFGRSETESTSSQSEREEARARLHSGKPIYQGATGMLQYYLLRNRPSYVSRAEDRRQCIAQMQYLRELREHSKRRLLSLTEPAMTTQLPPPPLAVKRVFSQQTMRRQTEKKYRQLSEVRGRQQDTKRKEGYRTNKLMAEIFNKKLQKRVLKGEVNLSNSVSVISNL